MENLEIQESWLIFKNHLLQTQELSTTMSIKSSKGVRRLAQMSKELLTNVRIEKDAK